MHNNGITFHKVKHLPDVLEPNAIYLVDLGDIVEAYVTTNTPNNNPDFKPDKE